MEARTSLNQTLPRIGFAGKEDPKRGMDPKIPLMGSAVKRKRLMLSDITNTVSSSRVAISGAQFQEKPKEVACGITKECIGQLMEENATLLKALGERNKIIELSSIEMQKLRFTLEKANQQNRMLAQAHSQMLAELTLSKERLKTLQHELGCTMAVLRLKNLVLDEKEKLNKELSEKILIQEGHSELVEVATNVRHTHSICNSTACRSDGISQSDEKLDNELRKNTKTEKENSVCSEVATAASLPHSLTSGTASNPNRRHTLRSKSNINNPLEAKEKVTNELHVKTRAEGEHSECAKLANDASLSRAVGSNTSCEPNRKQTLRSRSLGAATAVTHQVEAKEKDARRKSSRRRSNNLTSEAREPEDNLLETENLEVPACPVINELLNECNTVQAEPSANISGLVEAGEKDETRTRKTSRRRSNNLTSKACESEDNVPEIENVKVPACPVVTEPPNEDGPSQVKLSATMGSQGEAEEKGDARTRMSSRRISNNLTSEGRKSKDNLPEAETVEVPACPVISEPPNEGNPVPAKSSANMKSQIEAAERDDARKSSRRRSTNRKSEPRESKDHYLETVDLKIPACPPVIESLNEDNPVQERTSAPLKYVQKDQTASSQSQGQELRRTSVGRPMRRAAEKVCSYKEVPINVKMRRAE